MTNTTTCINGYINHLTNVHFFGPIRTELCLKEDFYPIYNGWTIVNPNDYDTTTGRYYWGDTTTILRTKHILLATFGTAFHCVAAVMTVAFRILATPLYLLFSKDSLKDRSKIAGTSFVSIITDILTPVGLLLASVYGLFKPLDGRKLYASIERLRFGAYLNKKNHNVYGCLASCMQPLTYPPMEPTVNAGDNT